VFYNTIGILTFALLVAFTRETALEAMQTKCVGPFSLSLFPLLVHALMLFPPAGTKRKSSFS